MTSERSSTTSNNPLESYILLAKASEGDAAVELIKQVLEAPNVYVFGELLDMPNVKELENGPFDKYFQLLNIFAYGTYQEYVQLESQLPELTPCQLRKLKHLTLVTLATKTKCLSYKVLLDELDITNVRDLEDLIIDAIYADIIHGKLDQKNNQLEVDYAMGRDIKSEDLGSVIDILQDWSDSCETVLSCIETQIKHANAEKNRSMNHKEAVQQEVMKHFSKQQSCGLPRNTFCN